MSGWSSSTRSTTRPTRATGRRGSRPATWRSSSAGWPGAAVVLGLGHAGGRERGPRPRRASIERVVLPGAAGRRGRRRRGRRPARRARRGQARPAVAAARDGARRARHGRGRAGDPRAQPARHGVGRAVPRLRPRPGLSRLRAAARLPPGRDDAALPPLRPGDAAGDRAARSAARRASATSAAARNGSSARSATGSPALRVGRLDRDVVERRGAAERVIDAFADGRLDVLVGTSLVAKGLDIPAVTLVGVVSSDVALNLPDERAAERTYQLLAQAIGRAGRGDRPGPRDPPDLPARPPGDRRGRRAATRTAFYDAELDAAPSGSGRRRSGGSSS